MKVIKSLNEALKKPSEVQILKLKLKGKVPLAILNFEKLKELYLDGVFTECNLDFSLLTFLKTLCLNSSNLHEFPYYALRAPSLVNLKIINGNFTHLRLPLLHNSPLTSLTIKNTNLCEIPLEISEFQELTEINLSGNRLIDLPPTLIYLKKLKRINIDNNHFKSLSDVIKNIPALTHLSCDGNPFSEEEKNRIQREFGITPL